jgi:hypothetical protein
LGEATLRGTSLLHGVFGQHGLGEPQSDSPNLVHWHSADRPFRGSNNGGVNYQLSRPTEVLDALTGLDRRGVHFGPLLALWEVLQRKG